MTTTEVELYDDADVEVIEAMTKREAVALNKKIQKLSSTVADASFDLLSLLEQAADGNIHVALGYKSWTAWFQANVQIDLGDKDNRKRVLAMMSNKGMSQRAIATSTGISQMTVSRDLQESTETDDSVDETIGLDGKTRSRKKAKDEESEDDWADEVIDGEVVDDEEVFTTEDGSTAILSLAKEANEGISQWVERLLKISEADDRFTKSAKTIHKRYYDTLHDAYDSLGAIIDKLASAAEEL